MINKARIGIEGTPRHALPSLMIPTFFYDTPDVMIIAIFALCHPLLSL